MNSGVPPDAIEPVWRRGPWRIAMTMGMLSAIGMVLVAIRHRAGLHSASAVIRGGGPSAAYAYESLSETASAGNMVFGVRQSLFIELTILGFAVLSVLAFGMRTQRAMVRIQALRLLTSARSESLRELATLLSPAATQADVTGVLTIHGARSVGAIVSNVAAPNGYVPHVDRGDLAMWVSPHLSTEEAEQWTWLVANEHTPMRDAYVLGLPVLIDSDKELKSRYPDLVQSAGIAGVVASASFPLFNSQEIVVGVIGFGWSDTQHFDSDLLAMLDTASRIAGQALERSALYDREQSARIEVQAIQHFAAELSVAGSVQGVADVVVRHAASFSGADSVTLSTRDPNRETTTLSASYGFLANPSAPTTTTSNELPWRIPLPVEAFHPLQLVLHLHQDSSISSTIPSVTENFVARAVVALDRERRVELAKRSADQARLLAEVIGVLGSAETENQVADGFVQSLPSFAATGGLLGVFDEYQKRFEVLQVHFDPRSDHSTTLSATSVVLRRDLLRTAMGGNPSFTSDGTFDRVASIRDARVSEDDWAFATKSFAMLPLMVAGRAVGLAVMFFDERQNFDDEQRVELTSYAALCANALTRSQRFEHEHEVAMVLQASLLPQVPEVIGQAELAGRYRPSTRNLSIGGDWFDAVDLGNSRVLLVVGDVVGHGIHSAASMGKLSTAARALAPIFPEPADLLTQLDRFTGSDPDTRFASVAVVLVDLFAAKISASIAGHPIPLVVSSTGQVVELQTGRGPAIGARTFTRTQCETALEARSTIILYTDGLTERRDTHIDTRNRQLTRAAGVSFRPVDEMADHLLNSMLDEEQVDDVALLVARFDLMTASFDQSIPGRMTSLRSFRCDLRAWLRHVQVVPEEIDDLLLATGEVITNSIEHGHRNEEKPVHVHATHELGSCRIVVTDQGDWLRTHDRTEVPNSSATRGRGMALVHALMDDVQVERRPEGTVVTLSKTMNQRRS